MKEEYKSRVYREQYNEYKKKRMDFEKSGGQFTFDGMNFIDAGEKTPEEREKILQDILEAIKEK